MDGQPLVKVVRGTPTAEELAALVGALLCQRSPQAPAPAPASHWAASARPARPRHANGAWRTAARPHRPGLDR